jgi:hypothetical protein
MPSESARVAWDMRLGHSDQATDLHTPFSQPAETTRGSHYVVFFIKIDKNLINKIRI